MTPEFKDLSGLGQEISWIRTARHRNHYFMTTNMTTKPLKCD